MSKISFIKSDDRKYNIERCLSLIKGEIISGLKNANKVVVKPSCVVDNNKLACTNVDALDAVLEFIKPLTKTQITLAEGVGIGDTMTAFKNYEYLTLQDKYDFSLTDLNIDDYKEIDLVDRNGKIWSAQIAKTILEADYLISVSPPKTHNEAVYTGAIKNVAVGSLIRTNGSLPARIASRFGIMRNNKSMIHQGYKALNQNIKLSYDHIPLKLAVLDGYEIMEGNGPIGGDMVPAHFAVASSDPLAADWLTCMLFGIKIKDVGYLSMLDEEDKIKEDYFVIGDNWQKNVMKIKMHPNFEIMKKWQNG